MASDPNSYNRRRPGFFWGAAISMLLLGTVVGAIALGIFAHTAQEGLWDHLAALATGRSRTEYKSQPSVVAKIQQLQRLETVVYTMDKMVEGDRQSLIFPDFLAGDKLLLVAHGEVIAGIDMSRLKPADVSITGRRIRVHLPPAEVFLSRLDSGQTRVYSRMTGLLVSADQNLESEVRQKAEQGMREGALADGILNRATQNARATIKSMLLSLGFETVDVD